MDQQSEQPMLGTSSRAKLEVVDAENQKPKLRPTSSLFRTGPNKWLILAIVIVSLLCLILFITIGALAYDRAQLCLTPECLRSSSNFLDSIDNSVQPCDNFYNFVCGKWNREHFIRQHYSSNSWFMERAWVVEKDTIQFLEEEDKDNEPEGVKKARVLYRGCMDIDSMGDVGHQTLLEIMENEIGLGYLPPVKPKLQELTESIAKIKLNIDLDILFGFSLGMVPTNNTVIKFTFSQPSDHIFSASLKSRLSKLTSTPNDDDEDYNYDDEEEEEEDPNMVNYWKNEVIKFINHLYMMTGESPIEYNADINHAASDLMFIKDRFTELSQMDEVKNDPTSREPEEMNIYELQSLVDKVTTSKKSKIEFKKFMLLTFEDLPMKEYLEKNETVLVHNKVYLQEVSKYLEKLSPAKINLWIWWNVMYTLAPHVDKYTAGLRNAIDATIGEDTKTSRAASCSKLVITVMKRAASYLVMREPNSEIIRAKVKEMLKYIKAGFVSLINEITWMDKETKARTLEKVTAMKEYIAYPEQRKNFTYLNEEAQNLTFDEGTHLKNFLAILKEGHSLESLDTLHEPFNLSAESFDSLDTNAYYTQAENSIYIPGGILQFPFYDLGLEALNYGSIGTILGHEVTHGFDNEGRKYDKNGNLHEWWTENSDNEYQKRIPCYVNDYGSYFIESVNMTVDGQQTLGENIADIGGLLEAFNAYKQYISDYGTELKLPGFEDYSGEQLFFMSYAMTWCSEYTKDSLSEALADEHSPDFVRNVMSLRNSKEFAESWNCPKGSYMNPNKPKCQLWVD